MAFRNGSLIPRHAPPPSTAAILHRHQSEPLGESPTTTVAETEPKFLKSIEDLTAFSAAFETFKRRFDDLQNHMDSISNAIDSKLKSNRIETAAAPAVIVTCESPPTETEVSNKTEVERLCELMCSKGLRKYVNGIITEKAKLLEELPLALRLAKEPSKFVLECIGKFYLQGKKAFSRNSPMISARKVSLLILECFLLMVDDPKEFQIQSSVKDEAETAAVAWRKRLIGEGGLAAAEAMDARGLLLLIACFGVPLSFRNMDLLDLIKQSRSGEVSGALRRSPFLVPMVSGIVESSFKRGKHIEALEVVFTFGLEEKFSASSVLTTFLKTSKESFEREKRKAQAPKEFKEAIKKQLAALSSVKQCLDAHKLDPKKEVPGWQIKEEIVKLERDALQIDKEIEDRARSESLMQEVELTRRLYDQQMKRPRLSAVEMQPVASSSYSPLYRDRNFPNHRDGGDRDEISALVSSYLGPASGFPHRSILRRSPDYTVSPGGLVRNVSAYEHLTPNSYTPVLGSGSRPHSLYSPPVHGQQQQIPIGLQRVYRHSPSAERYLDLPNHRSPRRDSSRDHLGGM